MILLAQFLRYLLTGFVAWFTTETTASQQFSFVKTKATTLKKPATNRYPLLIVGVALLTVLLWAALTIWNLRLNPGSLFVGALAASALSFTAAWASIQPGVTRRGKAVAIVGILAAAICAAVYGWTVRTARFQLTAASYPALHAAHVPADLIADLKNVDTITADTEQQFVDGLSARLGQDHIAPYRDALVHCCWKCHLRTALIAAAGLSGCFSLVLGSWVVVRFERS